MSEAPKPLGLTDIFLMMAAAWLWFAVMMLLNESPLGSPLLTVFVLFGTTIAAQRLLRGRTHSWSLSAILAPLLSLGFIFIVAAFASHS